MADQSRNFVCTIKEGEVGQPLTLSLEAHTKDCPQVRLQLRAGSTMADAQMIKSMLNEHGLILADNA